MDGTEAEQFGDKIYDGHNRNAHFCQRGKCDADSLLIA